MLLWRLSHLQMMKQKNCLLVTAIVLYCKKVDFGVTFVLYVLFAFIQVTQYGNT